MSKALETQRTYALVGTGGSGKTTVSEMLLFHAGVINRLGKVEEGSTQLDYEPEEIKRRGSIQPAFAHFTWDKNHHYLMDVPGDNNFIGDFDYLLKGVDGAVFVIDAVDGVRPLTRRLWQKATDAGLAKMVFISKMDRDRADFSMAFDGLGNILGAKTVLLHMPIGAQANFSGVVDVLENTAYSFDADGKLQKIDIPADMADEVATYRETTIENIAESDEELMEKYLEEGELSTEEMKQGLRSGVVSGQLVPVIVGSGLENKGGTLLLDAIQALLPSPLEHPAWEGENDAERESTPDAPVAAFVFKTLADPFAGQLTILRVLSGQFSPDTSYKNVNKDENERVGQVVFLTGKTQTQCKEPLGPGAIIAVTKLKNTETGDCLCDEKNPFQLKKPVLPPPLITYALAPKEKGDEDKVYSSVHKLLTEDITLQLTRDEESSDILLSGMGQLHIETSVERAKRRYKADIVLKPPKVPYRETIKASAEVQGRHKKQSGGRGQFGDCWVRFEPQPRGAGYEYVDAIVGGVIPRQFIPAVDKGVQEASKRGFLSGNPMVDFKATVYDGSYHTVDLL